MENEQIPQVAQTPPEQSSRIKIFAILIVAMVCIALGVFIYHTLHKVSATGAAREPLYLLTDSDADGLTDAQEITLGTDPHNPDTDGDGLSDGFEVNSSHTDPKNAHSKDPVLTDLQWVYSKAPRR